LGAGEIESDVTDAKQKVDASVFEGSRHGAEVVDVAMEVAHDRGAESHRKSSGLNIQS
jgi:hypothetical protein